MKKAVLVITCVAFFISLYGQTHVGEPIYIKYNEEQEKFVKGKFGFNPNFTIEQNKKHYADMGYTMSYKYSDIELCSLMIAILVIIFGLFFYFNIRDHHNKKFETQN